MTATNNTGKSKMKKIGAIWTKKTDPNHFSLKLGQEGSNTKYNLSVEVIVRDADGQVVARQTDGFLTLKDPRENPFSTDEQKAKIPNTLQYDVLIPSTNT